MRMSFYQLLMTQRDPNSADRAQQFANSAFLDTTFPKHSEDFDEISHYLEKNVGHLPSMIIFDEA